MYVQINCCFSCVSCTFVSKDTYYYDDYYDDYYYYHQVAFNQTEYKFSVPVDAPPGTKVGTAWISMPLSLVTLEDGTLPPIELNGIYKYFYGLVINSDGTPWTSYQEYFDIEVYFANKPEDVVEESGDAKILNLTLDDVNFCGNEHILIPVDIYTRSEIFGIGTYSFEVDISFIINHNYFYAYTNLLLDVSFGKYL